MHSLDCKYNKWTCSFIPFSKKNKEEYSFKSKLFTQPPKLLKSIMNCPIRKHLSRSDVHPSLYFQNFLNIRINKKLVIFGWQFRFAFTDCSKIKGIKEKTYIQGLYKNDMLIHSDPCAVCEGNSFCCASWDWLFSCEIVSLFYSHNLKLD